MELLKNIKKLWERLGEPDVNNVELTGELAIENFEALKIFNVPKEPKNRFKVSEQKAREVVEKRYNEKNNDKYRE